MKKKTLITAIIAFFVTCGASSGQELKPLKSFDNDVNEYLKGNLIKGNTLFKGCRFGDVIAVLEAKFLMAEIQYQSDSSSLFMFLYLQSPEYVYDHSLDERYLTGITIYFEENDNLSEATGKIMGSFSRDLGPIVVPLSDENIDKLIALLNDSKIRAVRYRETVRRMLRID